MRSSSNKTLPSYLYRKFIGNGIHCLLLRNSADSERRKEEKKKNKEKRYKCTCERLRVSRRRFRGRRIRDGGLAQVRNRSVRRRRPGGSGTLVLPGRGVAWVPGHRRGSRKRGQLGWLLTRGMSRAKLPVALPVAPLVLLSAIEDDLAARAPEQLVSSVANRADGHLRRRVAACRASITFPTRGPRATDGRWRQRRHRLTLRSRVLLASLR